MGAELERLFAMLLFGGLSGLCLYGWYAGFRTRSGKYEFWTVAAGVAITALMIMLFLSTLGVSTLIRAW